MRGRKGADSSGSSRTAVNCNAMRPVHLGFLCLLLAGCGTKLQREAPDTPSPESAPAPAVSTPAPVPAPAPSRGGAYYKDDGPGTAPPPDMAAIPDAVPKVERLHRQYGANAVVIRKDYTVFEVSGHREETDNLIKVLEPYGLIEFVRSARVAIIKDR